MRIFLCVRRQDFKALCLAGAFLILVTGCEAKKSVNREVFSSTFSDICKKKYQTHVTLREAEDTIWIYLPYTPGRGGRAQDKKVDNNLYLEYAISSFNPYKAIDPPELKFVVQKILGEIRNLFLRCDNPYQYFVLVVANIADPSASAEQWYVGYLEDIKNYSVGKDFSGEGYSRLAWRVQKLNFIAGSDGKPVSEAYRDIDGGHVDYHNITLEEFVKEQINWRIYKRFTVEYNKIPFDLTPQEKRGEVIRIIRTVLNAYNFRDFEKIYIKDGSFFSKEDAFVAVSQKDLQEPSSLDKMFRKPAF